MRKLGLILALLAVAGLAHAGPQWYAFEVSYGATHTNILTDSQSIRGYIDEVYFQAPTEAATTAAVSIVSTPVVGTGLATTTLYTNATLAAAVKARPRVTQTDNAGADLTSLTVAERFLCLGDTVTLRVDQTTAVTGVTFRAWIKIDE